MSTGLERFSRESKDRRAVGEQLAEFGEKGKLSVKEWQGSGDRVVAEGHGVDAIPAGERGVSVSGF